MSGCSIHFHFHGPASCTPYTQVNDDNNKQQKGRTATKRNQSFCLYNRSVVSKQQKKRLGVQRECTATLQLATYKYETKERNDKDSPKYVNKHCTLSSCVFLLIEDE